MNQLEQTHASYSRLFNRLGWHLSIDSERCTMGVHGYLKSGKPKKTVIAWLQHIDDNDKRPWYVSSDGLPRAVTFKGLPPAVYFLYECTERITRSLMNDRGGP